MLFATPIVHAQQSKINMKGLKSVIFVYDNGTTETVTVEQFKEELMSNPKNSQVSPWAKRIDSYISSDKKDNIYGPVLFFPEYKELQKIIMKGIELDTNKAGSAYQELFVGVEAKKDTLDFFINKSSDVEISYNNSSFTLSSGGKITLNSESDNPLIELVNLSKRLSSAIKTANYWASQK